MLALADKNGIVEASVPGLSDISRVTMEQCEEALQKLAMPDPYSRSQDYEGRRVQAVDGGWLLLNYVKYRGMLSAERKREQGRIRQRRFREKRKCNAGVTRDAVTNANITDNAQSDPYTEADSNTTEVRYLLPNRQIDLEVSNKKTPYSPPMGDESLGKSKKPYTKDFLDFWSAYPRKVGKGTAFKAWQRAKKNGLPELNILLAAVKKQKKSRAWTKDGGEYIPHPATWINGSRWEDSVEIEADEEEYHDPLPDVTPR